MYSRPSVHRLKGCLLTYSHEASMTLMSAVSSYGSTLDGRSGYHGLQPPAEAQDQDGATYSWDRQDLAVTTGFHNKSASSDPDHSPARYVSLPLACWKLLAMPPMATSLSVSYVICSLQYSVTSSLHRCAMGTSEFDLRSWVQYLTFGDRYSMP